jgi:hypothetical protein
MVSFDRPKWLGRGEHGLFVNAHIVLPRIADWSRAELGLPLMTRPGLADGVWQQTLGESELGGSRPKLWIVPNRDADLRKLGDEISRRLTDDVLPWFDHYGSDMAVRDVWISQMGELRGHGLKMLVVLLEALGPPAELREASVRLANDGS